MTIPSGSKIPLPRPFTIPFLLSSRIASLAHETLSRSTNFSSRSAFRTALEGILTSIYVFFEGDAENINPRAFGVKNPYKAGIKIYRKKGTSGWGSSKLEYFKAKAYSPEVPIIVRGNNDTETTYVNYGSKSKLKCTVYPESASSAKLTYKSSNSLIKVSSSGYVTTTTKGREDSNITVYYNGKKIDIHSYIFDSPESCLEYAGEVSGNYYKELSIFRNCYK